MDTDRFIVHIKTEDSYALQKMLKKYLIIEIMN